ncbi:uncharacterized protein LOC131247293 [Magnolia sinica]|uniref:uncharacterized protein LOC131247293 n=1 Tax=Magnolia sinica TaxID=86752 RepID=UPI002658271B|nr:uncharacterized protein LOC131247293 [Magnolia sinica]
MGRGNVLVWVAVIVVLVSIQATSAEGNGEKKPNLDAASTHYFVLPPVNKTGQEQVLCLARGRCFLKTLTCPTQCIQRKPRQNRKVKGCFVDCSSKCETTCKHRKPNCNGFGSVCYDPRFVGGDGVMFYFHGAKGSNFALVSDDQLQINAYFIGTRPEGRTRDFTWVQSLGILFDSHNLIISAKHVAKWDDNVDALTISWDQREVVIPTDGEAEWRIMSEKDGGREVSIERTDEFNSVRITISGLVEMDVKVTPIGEAENRAHNYQLPAGDAFAHLETQFRFTNLTDMVDGILGQTYRPRYISPVRTGIPMPMMGGEDKYFVKSLYSPNCNACRFQRTLLPTSEITDSGDATVGVVAQF